MGRVERIAQARPYEFGPFGRARVGSSARSVEPFLVKATPVITVKSL
jgi:hypothetical protein